ncbi:hypothetical protein L226DRAFT_615878 [Lentinus tigrinus ALCF2SS1-7]|uniref:uncharacterized protein n=1 Tax=Lentinus tigrinus ALCF2SS1-7 TaxID=1328758 RepID=UPI00116625DE|nr:hypothetical protein L226DRAFT_615878 [Lentinus tigrinus ALCF2SS1-7]
MSDFPTQVHALSTAARELRLLLLDNQATISWIDAYCHSHLLERWKGIREEYRKMLDEGESAATRLATSMNTYVGLHEYMGDSSMLEDLIEEFEGLSKDDDLGNLKGSLERLGQDIDVLLKAHTPPVEHPVSASGAAFTRSSQEPAMHAIANQYLSHWVWGRSDRVIRTTSSSAPMTGPMRAETTSGLESGKPAGVTGIQAMPAVLQLAEKNLETQKSLSRAVLVEMKDKVRSPENGMYDMLTKDPAQLAYEIQTYLTASRNAQAVASPENQLALRNATRRVTSSTDTWRERAKLLTDGYAKAPK